MFIGAGGDHGGHVSQPGLGGGGQARGQVAHGRRRQSEAAPRVGQRLCAGVPCALARVQAQGQVLRRLRAAGIICVSNACDICVSTTQVKSSDVFVRDSTCVSDYGLLLFGGALTHTGGALAMCNGYATFAAGGDVAAVVSALRAQIDALLRRKIETPSLALGAVSDGLVQVHVCAARLHPEP